jgi:hypothetical protein
VPASYPSDGLADIATGRFRGRPPTVPASSGRETRPTGSADRVRGISGTATRGARVSHDLVAEAEKRQSPHQERTVTGQFRSQSGGHGLRGTRLGDLSVDGRRCPPPIQRYNESTPKGSQRHREGIRFAGSADRFQEISESANRGARVSHDNVAVTRPCERTVTGP